MTKYLLFLLLILNLKIFATPTVVVQANGVTGTLNLTHQNATCEDDGVNQFALSGRSSTGTGLPMQWAWTWTKTSYTGAGTGKAVFENINAPQTQVDSLDVGTYVFTGSAVDLAGGSAGTSSVTVIVAAAGSCPVWTTTTRGTPNTNQFLQVINENYQIIYINPGAYYSLYMKNSNHIKIRVTPGATRVSFSYDVQIGENAGPCSYIDIDGGGVTGLTGFSANKGIIIYSPGTSGHAGLYRVDASRCHTARNIEIAGSLNTGGTNGQGIGWDIYNQYPNDTTTSPLTQTHSRLNFNSGNDTLENIYIHGPYNEGIYDGPSHYGWLQSRSNYSIYLEPPLNSLYMNNVRIDSCGQSAMNLGACINGAIIKNSQFLHYALRQQFGHNAGININPGTKNPRVFNNYFLNALNFSNEVQGISYHGSGSLDLFYNNVFVNVLDPFIMLRSTDANEGKSDGHVFAYNNTIINPKYGLDIYSFNFSAAGRITWKNNIIGANAATFIASGNDWTGLDSSNNKLSLVSLAAIKFIDTTAGNYGILSTSPAGTSGLDESALFTTDYLNATRVVPWTSGAYALTTTPPTANAGSNQTITLPTSSVSLTGTGTGNGGATITGYAWTKTSGPVSYTITTPTTASTTVTGLVAGTYVFTLTVTDSNSNTASSSVTITVNPASLYKTNVKITRT